MAVEDWLPQWIPHECSIHLIPVSMTRIGNLAKTSFADRKAWLQPRSPAPCKSIPELKGTACRRTRAPCHWQIIVKAHVITFLLWRCIRAYHHRNRSRQSLRWNVWPSNRTNDLVVEESSAKVTNPQTLLRKCLFRSLTHVHVCKPNRPQDRILGGAHTRFGGRAGIEETPREEKGAMNCILHASARGLFPLHEWDTVPLILPLVRNITLKARDDILKRLPALEHGPRRKGGPANIAGRQGSLRSRVTITAERNPPSIAAQPIAR